jgi:hypothetical protein
VQNVPDDLFTPADDERDLGSHGRFDDRAHALSVQLSVAHRVGDLGRSAQQVLGRALVAWPALRAGFAAARAQDGRGSTLPSHRRSERE